MPHEEEPGMMENPAAWGKAEWVIHETLDEYEADPDIARKPPLESLIADALEAAGLLRPGSFTPGSGRHQRPLGVNAGTSIPGGRHKVQVPIPGVNAPLGLKGARDMAGIGCSKGHIKVIDHLDLRGGKQVAVYKCGRCGKRL